MTDVHPTEEDKEEVGQDLDVDGMNRGTVEGSDL